MNTEYEHKKSKQKGGFLHAQTIHTLLTQYLLELKKIYGTYLKSVIYMVPTQEATIHRILI